MIGEGMHGLVESKLHEAIAVVGTGVCGDQDGFRLADIAGSDDCLESHSDVFVACSSAENGERVIQAIVPPTGNAGGVGTGAVIFCVEKAVKQPAVDDFVRFKYADGFVEFVFQVGIAEFQAINPFLSGGRGVSLG